MTENDTITTTTAAADSLAVWLEMWNGDADIARLICSDDFRIHFGTTETDGSSPGDDVRGGDAFATYLGGYHAQHPDVVFSEVAQAIDGEHGRMLWNVAIGDRHAGGVDIFDFTAEGLVNEVWSVTGSRPMTV
ncbi:hypothetical protein AX769_16810 [Frondihabitans sp. PAMC 28766]|uniref:nuclear transport factor 2 family protein n=1 Tax=Frondihabitans sp. PAMC 28766 TaxID=1795630 RepID=UPI00078C8519|nr:nuclear transport factor 2 family protein [Frondihabitans sp. PAMC 28766]AMM21493.1 hypothetical protein AX769_16810 [Frondihabitans sp. PAMC 28766]